MIDSIPAGAFWALSLSVAFLTAALIFLSHRLANTNRNTLDAYRDAMALAKDAMRHALSINDDARAFMATDRQADVLEAAERAKAQQAAIFQGRVPMSPGPQGPQPLNEDAVIDYMQQETGRGGG